MEENDKLDNRLTALRNLQETSREKRMKILERIDNDCPIRKRERLFGIARQLMLIEAEAKERERKLLEK